MANLFLCRFFLVSLQEISCLMDAPMGVHMTERVRKNDESKQSFIYFARNSAIYRK